MVLKGISANYNVQIYLDPHAKKLENNICETTQGNLYNNWIFNEVKKLLLIFSSTLMVLQLFF